MVPFAGGAGELRATVRALGTLRTRPGDEVIVVDDRPGAVGEGGRPAAGPRGSGEIRLVAGGPVHGPAAARNVGAREAGGEWLVFLDADVRPDPDLIDRYLQPEPAPQTGVLAGRLIDVAPDAGVAGRWAVTRAKMGEGAALAAAGGPYAQTANCAVRAAAFRAVGGFAEAARAGEDADLCWRLADDGWRLEHRPDACAGHLARDTLTGLLRQLAHHGAGMAWLEHRRPGSFPAPGRRELAGRLPAHLLAALRAPRGDRMLILVDLLALCARDLGRLRGNRPPRHR